MKGWERQWINTKYGDTLHPHASSSQCISQSIFYRTQINVTCMSAVQWRAFQGIKIYILLKGNQCIIEVVIKVLLWSLSRHYWSGCQGIIEDLIKALELIKTLKDESRHCRMNHGIIEELTKAFLMSEARHYQRVNQGIIKEFIKALWKSESRHYWRVSQG